MSSDPFANTTTVKNILQHVLSPKIVNDGNGGFRTETDLVNIDTVKARRLELIANGGNGTSGNRFTGQSGFATVVSGNNDVTFYHTSTTTSSIITATSSNFLYPVYAVTAGNGTVNIRVSPITAVNVKVYWFISSF
jgi:hypothetical protein